MNKWEKFNGITDDRDLSLPILTREMKTEREICSDYVKLISISHSTSTIGVMCFLHNPDTYVREITVQALGWSFPWTSCFPSKFPTVFLFLLYPWLFSNHTLRSIFLWLLKTWNLRQKARGNIATNEIKLSPGGTCLIMTRKRYPWEKGWQCADLSARLSRICLEPALSPHVGRAAVRHTQVTAPTVKRFFYGVSPQERSRYAISMTESLADARSGAVWPPRSYSAH